MATGRARKPISIGDVIGERVHVYMNLHNGMFSVSDGSKLIGHINNITLKDAEFKVRKGGWNRALKEQSRNVHAFVVGTVTEDSSSIAQFGITGLPTAGWVRARYNYNLGPCFWAAEKPVFNTRYCHLMIEKGCLAWRPHIEGWKTRFVLKYGNRHVGYLTHLHDIKEWTWEYSEEWKRSHFRGLYGYNNKEMVYKSYSLPLFFRSRVPPRSREDTKRICKENRIDINSDVEMLIQFGGRTLSNPFVLELA